MLNHDESENEIILQNQPHALTIPLIAFRGDTIQAVYTKTTIDSYWSNPLIEALPPLWNEDTVVLKLQWSPRIKEADRWRSDEERNQLIQLVVDFFQPLPMHIDLERRISRMLRMGYSHRNPVHKNFWVDIDKRLAAMRQNPSRYNFRDQTYEDVVELINEFNQRQGSGTLYIGFNFIGTSGIGKTRSLEAILKLYPQIIIHNNYYGAPFPMRQLVWLKLECPKDGSTRALCLNFLRTLDGILGTNYSPKFKRESESALIEIMARYAANHAIGVLVIDEIQHLNAAKSGGAERMLNFFVDLVNTIGIPVILVGTPGAFRVIGEKFRQGRRGTGQGDVLWDRMKEDETWNTFIRSLWRHQYVRYPVPLTDELSHTLYYESQGITDLAVKAFLLAQYRAIETGLETITCAVIKSVATDSFVEIRDAIAALKMNDRHKISQYEDILLSKIDLGSLYVSATRSVNSLPSLQDVEERTDKSTTSIVINNTSQQHQDNSQHRPEQLSISSASQHKNKKNFPTDSLQNIISTAKAQDIPAYNALLAAGYIKSATEYVGTEHAL